MSFDLPYCRVLMMKALYEKLPDTPGVYVMRGERNKVLYIGKATNLRRRVSSYFLRAHDARLERLVSEIRHIDHIETDTAIDALILEAQLIRKYQPPFNIREKDDKSFLYIEIPKEAFPRILLVRGTEPVQGKRYGPFVSSTEVRKALRIIRKIFPFNMHAPHEIGTFKRPCFDKEVGLCPGTCVGAISKTTYAKTVRNIRYLFEGKRKRLIGQLEREMLAASKKLQFEEAERLRRQIFSLTHVRDAAFVRDDVDAIVVPGDEKPTRRIEGYDISNISGVFAVGSMVVFVGNEPAKSEYRKFKVRTVRGSNDILMLEEVLRRRLKNDWPLPELFVIDGGVGQVNAALHVLTEAGVSIPVLGIAKGPKRDRNDIVGRIPPGFEKAVLIRVRDEAHRFAISYHRELRRKGSGGVYGLTGERKR